MNGNDDESGDYDFPIQTNPDSSSQYSNVNTLLEESVNELLSKINQKNTHSFANSTSKTVSTIPLLLNTRVNVQSSKDLTEPIRYSLLHPLSASIEVAKMAKHLKAADLVKWKDEMGYLQANQSYFGDSSWYNHSKSWTYLFSTYDKLNYIPQGCRVISA
jgi:hypothetical protein